MPPVRLTKQEKRVLKKERERVDDIGINQKLFFRLKHRKPAPCLFTQYTKCQMSKKKFIRRTYFDGFWVSTVFLGIDHNHFEDNNPITFETMIFQQGEHDIHHHLDQTQLRAHSHREALNNHWKCVAMVKEALKA